MRHRGLPGVPQRHGRRAREPRSRCIGESTGTSTEGINCLEGAPAGRPALLPVVALDSPSGSSIPQAGAPSTQIGRSPRATGRLSRRTCGCASSTARRAASMPPRQRSADRDGRGGLGSRRRIRTGDRSSTGSTETAPRSPNRYDDFFPSATDPGYAWFEFDSSLGPPHISRSALWTAPYGVGSERVGDGWLGDERRCTGRMDSRSWRC